MYINVTFSLLNISFIFMKYVILTLLYVNSHIEIYKQLRKTKNTNNTNNTNSNTQWGYLTKLKNLLKTT